MGKGYREFITGDEKEAPLLENPHTTTNSKSWWTTLT
jgi:hypothetical protein